MSKKVAGPLLHPGHRLTKGLGITMEQCENPALVLYRLLNGDDNEFVYGTFAKWANGLYRGPTFQGLLAAIQERQRTDMEELCAQGWAGVCLTAKVDWRLILGSSHGKIWD